MPDWSALVRERLRDLHLTSSQEDEIVVELAAHLEDRQKEECALGLSESEATRHALEEVTDWQGLTRKIHRMKHQEENMNYRTRCLWLPGLITLTTVMGSRMLLMRFGVEPRVFSMGLSIPSVGLELYLPWLLLLPVFGALGAFLSRRSNGRRSARLMAAIFPSLVLLGLFCLGLIASLFIDRHVSTQIVATAFTLSAVNWIVLPGAALLIGALPFFGPAQSGEVQPTSH